MKYYQFCCLHILRSLWQLNQNKIWYNVKYQILYFEHSSDSLKSTQDPNRVHALIHDTLQSIYCLPCQKIWCWMADIHRLSLWYHGSDLWYNYKMAPGLGILWLFEGAQDKLQLPQFYWEHLNCILLLLSAVLALKKEFLFTKWLHLISLTYQ